MNLLSRGTPGCLLAVALVAVGLASASGATQPLQGQIRLRPLTPNDLTIYNLGSLQGASGMTNVGVGQPAYLDAMVTNTIPPTNIVGVTWTLTSAPIGSAAVVTNSPLGANVPLYYPIDQLNNQLAGRAMLRPDMPGQYVVSATINCGSSGTTNVSATVTAGDYMGIETCELCHSGGLVAPDIVATWSNTPHASIFSQSIDGLNGNHYTTSCLQCHTVGYDTYPLATNGGFYQVAQQLGWTLPTVLTNGNWASMQTNYPTLANLANVQCENCHGAGSEHAYSLGDTNKISVIWDGGNCALCHDDPPHHYKSTEWKASVHAVTTSIPSGAGRQACVGCHTAPGYAGRIAGSTTTNTMYTPITCAACHDPHDASLPAQLRSVGPVTLASGLTITNYGTSETCMNCHQARNYGPTYVATTAGSSTFGPHHGPQSDMFWGVNGITYGQNIPSSAHNMAITNACVTCHMQATPTTSPAFLLAGGHTWNMSATVGGANIMMVAVCQQCHGAISTFDFPQEDYDGNGVIQGVQTEVKGLLSKLALLLPPVGVVKTNLSIDSTWTQQQLEAAYNYLFVQNDGSYGVHNLAYAVGLLNASILDLTGSPDGEGLPIAWQTEYFGSPGNPNADPNADPTGDGFPNWLKYALGLDPTVAGITVPSGVIWVNGSTQITPGSTNAIQIFPAAEVTFTTQVGETYQIQAISILNGNWVNIGSPITGTGETVSYLTSTRHDKLQFYRVIKTP